MLAECRYTPTHPSTPVSEVLTLLAYTSISLEGEYPGKRMKKMGVLKLLSAMTAAGLNDSWFTYVLPMIFSQKLFSALVMRSGL